MRLEAEHDTDALLVRLLVVRRAEDRVRRAIRTDRGLDDVRDEPLARRLIEIAEIFAGELGMAPEVVVGAVVDPLELLPAEGKLEFDVRRRGRVVRTLVGRVIAEAQLAQRDAVLHVPRPADPLPLVVETRRLSRRGEILHLHLLELAGAKDEVPGRGRRPPRRAGE